MIDFSVVKSMAIPEGAVKEITDASGRVIWAAVKKAQITITSQCLGINGDTSSITVKSTEPFADPLNPSNMVNTWTAVCYEEPNCTIKIPVGSAIECTVDDTKADERCYVAVNGVNVLTAPGTYVYTVTRDASLHMTDTYAMGEYGMITITE